MLWILVFLNQKRIAKPNNNASWLGALSLFGYCAAFSYAYLHLDTALGALILFGTVQLVIIGTSITSSEKTSLRTWGGVVLALCGFAYLMFPTEVNESKISVVGTGLMILSGISWAIYTLLGRKSETPLADSAIHFSRALYFCVPLAASFLFLHSPYITTKGLFLAIASGAITSGMGYAIWYKVLPRLTRLQAGVIQLNVPIVAALGGVIFVGESITLSFIVATVLLLGGVLITLVPEK
ncbi:DMT family transporter [Alteromonas sp. 5E99-2]|uniref:DMT family transporter n=1 Tax=Alteromonas sp. 5E99-2 TaxID=2817683 RepID=UPI001F612027|nr:DMT family transporter [Alteromonas sp. 5E99-2]